MKIKKRIPAKKTLIALFLAFALNLSFAFASADFTVTSFSCSPSASIIGSIFSCTAQVQNTGDAAGNLNTAYIYPDSNNWLESSVYTQAYGSSVSVGESISITFTGLKGVKSGNYGFSKIVLDNVEKTDYVSTTKVKIIDIVVTVDNSASSLAMSGSFTSTATVTAGGDIDVILTFTVDSGGCSIGNQPSQKIIIGLKSGNTQARTWTVTQGTSGDCKFTISAAATGSGTKVDSTPSTITCTDCPVDSGSSSSSGGGGGGGRAGTKTYILGEITNTETISLGSNERVKFNISRVTHYLSLINLSETEAKITIESKKQTFNLIVGNDINVDLNEDNKAEINVRLKSINLLTKKANLIITRISGDVPASSKIKETESGVTGKAGEEITGLETQKIKTESSSKLFIFSMIIIIIILFAIIIIYYQKNNVPPHIKVCGL